MELQLPVRHHSQVAFTHRGKDRRGEDLIGGEMLELDIVVVEEHPHEAARRRSEPVVELDERDDIALRRAWLSVLHRRRDPLGPCRGSERAQEPLLLEILQATLYHDRRAPLVGGDKSHRHRLAHEKARWNPDCLSSLSSFCLSAQGDAGREGTKEVAECRM